VSLRGYDEKGGLIPRSRGIAQGGAAWLKMVVRGTEMFPGFTGCSPAMAGAAFWHDHPFRHAIQRKPIRFSPSNIRLRNEGSSLAIMKARVAASAAYR